MSAVGMIEVLESFIPTASVFELDIQMFGVEPEHRHGGQEFSRKARFILALLRTDGLRPAFIDAVAETQPAVVLKAQYGLGKFLVCRDDQQAASKSLSIGHGHQPCEQAVASSVR